MKYVICVIIAFISFNAMAESKDSIQYCNKWAERAVEIHDLQQIDKRLSTEGMSIKEVALQKGIEKMAKRYKDADMLKEDVFRSCIEAFGKGN